MSGVKKLLLIATVVATLTCAKSKAESVVVGSTLPRVAEIDHDRVHQILRPDAIRSIDEPQFVPASQATFMRDDEPVVGFVANGVAKAYSTWHLDHHEIVNDDVGGKPVAVTW